MQTRRMDHRPEEGCLADCHAHCRSVFGRHSSPSARTSSAGQMPGFGAQPWRDMAGLSRACFGDRCSTQTSCRRNSGRSWQVMAASGFVWRVFDTNVVWRSVAQGGPWLAASSRVCLGETSAGHKHTLEPLKPILRSRSCSLTDRLKSGMDCLALPVLRRPMIGRHYRIELDCPPSRPDPSRRQSYVGQFGSVGHYLCQFPAQALVVFTPFCHSFGPPAGSRPRFHNCFAGGRIPIPHGVLSSHVAGNSGRRISAPPQNCHARAVNATRSGRQEGIVALRFCRGSWAFQAAQLAKAIAHLSKSPSQAHRMQITMTVRRSAIAACGSGMESTSIGIFYFGAGLLAKSDQAALEARATTDG